MEEIKTEKSVLYKHLSLYHDHNSSSNLSQRAIAHEIFEPFFTIGRAKRTKFVVNKSPCVRVVLKFDFFK